MASLGLYALAALLGLLAMVGISAVVGERSPHPDVPYESGVLPTGGTDLPFTPGFYVVAMMFVIFDMEAAFLITWAVSAREAGWLGFLEMLLFAGVLLVTLGWLWRVGALDATLRST